MTDAPAELLEAIVEAATHPCLPAGPWYVHSRSDTFTISTSATDTRRAICRVQRGLGDGPKARYIAAANPAALLAIGEWVRGLERDIQKLRDENFALHTEARWPTEVSRLEAENRELRAKLEAK